MRSHLSMRSGNPALSSKIFSSAIDDGSEKMTIEGTVNKISFSLLMLMATAFYSWTNPNPSLMIFGIIGGLIMAIMTIFKKTWAPYTVPGYAILEGLALGGISRFRRIPSKFWSSSLRKYQGVAKDVLATASWCECCGAAQGS